MPCKPNSVTLLKKTTHTDSRSGWSITSKRANAHAELCNCCASNSEICGRDSAERASISGACVKLSAAQAQAVFVMFNVLNWSCKRGLDADAIASSRGRFCHNNFAHAQAVFASSCARNSFSRFIAAEEIACNRGLSNTANNANALAVVAMCAGTNYCIRASDAADIAAMRGTCNISKRANDHAVLQICSISK